MNCTTTEFEDRIFKDTNTNLTGLNTIFTLGAFPGYRFGVLANMSGTFQAQTDLNSYMASSCWIWHMGAVIKDTTGLFIPINVHTPIYIPHVPSPLTIINTSQGPITISLSNHPSAYPFEIHKGNQIQKCECGASAVNSTQHSSWCDMSSLEVS